MKKIKIVFISLLIVALGVSAWFYAYHHRKSNDNLPTLAAIVEMDEADVNSLLMGYKRAQLHEVWSEPDESSSNQDIWQVHEGASLVVNYNNKDIVVICAIPSVVELNRDQICEMAKEEFEEMAGEVLLMMMAECSKAFERLPIVENTQILRNILYSGVWSKYDMVKQKRKEQKEK